MDLFENSKDNLQIFKELTTRKSINKKTNKQKKKTTGKSIKNLFKRSKTQKVKSNTKSTSKNNSSKPKRKFYSLFTRTKKNKQKPQTQQRRIYKQPGNTKSKAVMEGVRDAGRVDVFGWMDFFSG